MEPYLAEVSCEREILSGGFYLIIIIMIIRTRVDKSSDLKKRMRNTKDTYNMYNTIDKIHSSKL